MIGIDALAARLLAERERVPVSRSVLVALTGIDGCGKGFVAARLAEALRRRDVRVAGLNVDGWLNLPRVRFGERDPAEHFYRHALRFDEMFDRLVLPLRDHRAVHVEVDHADETATAYVRRRYDLDDVDVVVLEGIYLLKRGLPSLYDVSVWIDCTFDTALERAIARGQEGLGADATIAAYRTIYFPAQEIHFARDAPRAAASARLVNDARLAGSI